MFSLRVNFRHFSRHLLNFLHFLYLISIYGSCFVSSSFIKIVFFSISSTMETEKCKETTFSCFFLFISLCFSIFLFSLFLLEPSLSITFLVFVLWPFFGSWMNLSYTETNVWSKQHRRLVRVYHLTTFSSNIVLISMWPGRPSLTPWTPPDPIDLLCSDRHWPSFRIRLINFSCHFRALLRKHCPPIFNTNRKFGEEALL